MRSNRPSLLAGLLLVALAPAASAFRTGLPRRPAQGPELNVITTLGILGDLAETLGGDRVAVEVLSDPRQDPHYVEPKPTLMQKARRADVFIEVGLQLELWADKVAVGSGNPRIQSGQPGRVIASEGIRTLEVPRVLSREWGDVHPYGNPHVWLDPLNTKVMARNIVRAFADLDPPHADQYQENLTAFEQRVDEALFGPRLVKRVGGKKLSRLARGGRLDDYLERRGLTELLDGWLGKARPLKGRPIVTYHKTCIYLADRFGFSIPLEIEEKPGIPPSARHRDHVLEVMRQKGVRTILLEIFYDRTAADYLAERTGAQVTAVPIDIGPEVDAQHYFDLIDLLLDAALSSEAHGD